MSSIMIPTVLELFDCSKDCFTTQRKNPLTIKAEVSEAGWLFSLCFDRPSSYCLTSAKKKSFASALDHIFVKILNTEMCNYIFCNVLSHKRHNELYTTSFIQFSVSVRRPEGRRPFSVHTSTAFH